MMFKRCLVGLICIVVAAGHVSGQNKASLYVFNRTPLQPKPLTELPLGTIKPEGWLKDELQRMATGMTGHLDEWYPEVVGPRNAWLGGDGDCWERGPYWIDGLYPLACLLDDKTLIAKAQPWIEWTLTHQREDGYIGPIELKREDRTRPAPRGAQVEAADDWWPRMVMLKILQQVYMATGDERVIEVLSGYFRYQLRTLPEAPLQASRGGQGGSWWARQRGGDNLMSVLWLYNVTGQSWLLELADLIYEQTLPHTDIFLAGHVLKLQRSHASNIYDMGSFHCVNLAQGMKSPIIRWQQDGDDRHIEAVHQAFRDIDVLHGQPHGLYGADEGMHGSGLTRGSELCTTVEMMFSLEKMVEITSNVTWADRLEKVALNALPTQCSDDHYTRQYFQQSNQVQITWANHSFYDDGGGRQVHGLLHGYPCCTCNYHQGWPKFVQHMWMASADRGLAALLYGPCQVRAQVADGTEVTLTEDTVYPFEDTIRFTLSTPKAVSFPLHLRIPYWCRQAKITINGQVNSQPEGGQVVQVARQWQSGDTVELTLPMHLRKSTWINRSVAIERGPLVYALRMEEIWSEVNRDAPHEVPSDGMHRGYRECRPGSAWNYALLGSALDNLDQGFKVVTHDSVASNPWTLANAPIELKTRAIRLPDWILYDNSAAPVQLSPVERPQQSAIEDIRLIPYGCTTLRISGFPWIR